MQSTLDMKKCVQNAAVAFLLVVFLGAAASFAQNPTATILGVVRDGTGAVIPDTSLTARNVETGQMRTTVSASDGSYRFSAMPVGNYEVQVLQAGFQTAVRSGLRLTVGLEAVVNFTLQVGAVEQRVEVTAEAPLVNTTTSSLGGLVDEQKVSELPLNGRNFVGLALLQPGVQTSRVRTGGGSIAGLAYSSNGAPLASNNTTLDGARINAMGSSSTATSATGNTLGIEGIQEFRVVTNALSAEYGMAMGSQMVIVSKSGTNTFHGSLFEYHRNDNLDARNSFDRTEDEPAGKRLPPFVRNNFGGSLGGPISQDKTFFHMNFEGLRERKSESRVEAVLPTRCKVGNACTGEDETPGFDEFGNPIPINPAVMNWLDLWPAPNLGDDEFAWNPGSPIDQNYGQVRLDHTFSDIDTMFGRYTIDDSETDSPRDLPGVGSGTKSRAQYLTFSESHVFSPTVINQVRFSYSRSFIDAVHTFTNQKFATPAPGFSLVPGKILGEIAVGDLTPWAPRGSNPNVFHQRIYSWSDDVFYTAGAHALKFGAVFNKFEQDMGVANDEIGVLEFDTISQFLTGRPISFRGAFPGSVFARDMRFNTIGFYLQDDWRVRPSLTLNLGLRYEFGTQVNEVSGFSGALRNIADSEGTLGIPFENPSKRNFSPRFGFAWDIGGNSMTALRGGFGILFDLGNMGTAIRYGSLNPPFAALTSLEGDPDNPLLDDFPDPFIVPLPVPENKKGRSHEILDFHMKQPRLYQWNLTLQRQFPWDMALSVGYVGTRGVRLLQPREANPRVPNTPEECNQFSNTTSGQRCWLTRTNPRVSPHWDDVIMMTAGGGSWYNALQVGFSKRLSNGLQFQNSYTWSNSMDDVQGQFQSEFSRTSGDLGADPGNMRYDWNPSAFDYRHNYVANAIYHLPNFASSGGGSGALLNGWWLSGIMTANTGFPVTVVINRQTSNSGLRGTEGRIDRPDLAPGRDYDSIVLGGRDVGEHGWFDPTAFVKPLPGFKGNTQRGGIVGPGFATLDFSVVKDTTLGMLGESGAIQFRAEFFNILNKTNLRFPERRIDNRRVGRITGTYSTSRQIQLALKLIF
ncbi:MAG: TonB-dependent receptor [Acidobacteria bacterium]|nr:TonB-dependent receptor [Acidobacteriota bacterium]